MRLRSQLRLGWPWSDMTPLYERMAVLGSMRKHTYVDGPAFRQKRSLGLVRIPEAPPHLYELWLFEDGIVVHIKDLQH